jgi:hypothetical protein
MKLLSAVYDLSGSDLMALANEKGGIERGWA